MKKLKALLLVGLLFIQVPGLNQDIVNLEDNTWLQMSPGREPDGRNYSHPILGGDNKVFYFGGGHNSYACNDIDFYDMSANAWTRSWTPECNTCGSGFRDANDRVCAIHTYQQVCWVPDQKVYFLNNYGIGTCHFDPAANTWTFLEGTETAPRTPSAWQTMHTFYCPVLQAPVCILTSQPYGIYVWNYTNNSWTKRPQATPQPLGWKELYSTYIASIKKHLVSARDAGMWLYDPAAETWEEMQNDPADVTGAQALSYDSANDVAIVVIKTEAGPYFAARVFIYDVQAGTWHEETLTGARPIRGDGHTWAGLWYDPDHNAHFFLNRTGQSGADTWVYKYKKTSSVETNLPAYVINKNTITVSPNPCTPSARLWIKYPKILDKPVKFCLYNITGKQVMMSQGSNLDLTGLATGLYILRASINKKIFSTRILLQE